MRMLLCTNFFKSKTFSFLQHRNSKATYNAQVESGQCITSCAGSLLGSILRLGDT